MVQGIPSLQVGDYIQMEAYNLFPGAAFVKDGHVHVVMEVEDYPHTEQIFVKSRITYAADAEHDDILLRPYLFHYMQLVALIGAVRNPKDFDDNNWGTSKI